MVHEYKDLEEASKALADAVMHTAGSAIAAKNRCTIVLTGGRTPRRTYELLAETPRSTFLDWRNCHFFWGDERWVEQDHPDSNYRLANKTLLSKIEIPPTNIHPMHTNYPTPETGAEKYEQHLRDFFGAKSAYDAQADAENFFPNFDLILLGMGTDGHTASLFPGSNLQTETIKWVTAVQAGPGSPPVPRISLTFPVINRARNVFFLIAGREKRRILDAIQQNPEQAAHYPAAHVKPAGRLTWFVAENS